jgi:iron(III) transport system ATP-binding protein
MSDSCAIGIVGLSKKYGETSVLQGVDLDVPDGSITAILGASGSGKTTLLKVIAGFESADAGLITIAGQTVDDGRRAMRPQHRGIGYVPQDAALFPHMTVAANIRFGVPRQRRAELADLIEMVGLTGLEKRYPHQLSGGQQQRVALARALAIKPRVVLLDEPFGSLDAALRETVRAEVVEILAETKTTTLLVTHDQDEALSLADHIALLDGGRIVAHGNPRDLYDVPASPEIATAIGTANLVPGMLDNGRIRSVVGVLSPLDRSLANTGDVTVLLRPEQVAISPIPHPDQLAATTTRVRFHGHDTLVDLVSDDHTTLIARLAGESDIRSGQQVWLSINGPVHVWPAHA